MPRTSRKELYRRLDHAIQDLRDRLGGLPGPDRAEDIWRDLWFAEAHHSTALEGNTLVLKQVAALLGEGRAVGNKELAEYLDVQGYAEAARWVYAHALDPGAWGTDELVTLTVVRHIPETAIGPVWHVAPHPHALATESPGSFRQHDIAPFPSGTVPPVWVEVPAAMTDWLRDVRRVATTGRPIEEIARAHAAFERLYPLLNGNGRTGRLVVNLMLVRLGYPPAIVYRRDRARYLRALQRADAGDAGSLAELLARSVLDNLYRFVVPAVAGPAELVPLVSLAGDGLSGGALRVAANRGRLRAQRGTDGQWHSTKAWVEEYRSTRYQRE